MEAIWTFAVKTRDLIESVKVRILPVLKRNYVLLKFIKHIILTLNL